MRLSTICIALGAAALATASPPHGHPPIPRQTADNEWIPVGPGGVRGPCPMLNSLANHGFFPRDGKNLTLEAVTHGLGEGLAFAPEFSALLFRAGVVVNPESNGTFFDLDHLSRHNILEHDASLSRKDAFFGANDVFDQATFDHSRTFWTAETVTAEMMANVKIARQVESRAFNPTYRFSRTAETFSTGEMAAPAIVFGDKTALTFNRTIVEYFFQNERLPYALGWTKKDTPITIEDLSWGMELIHNATNLLKDDPAVAKRGKKTTVV